MLLFFFFSSFFTVRLVKHWNGFSREVLHSPSSADIQSPSGRGPGQSARVDPAWARSIDYMIARSPFQPPQFGEYVFSSVLHCWVAYLRNHLLFFLDLFYLTVTYLIINVVWPQAANNHADECFADGYPAEVALRVVWRSFSSRLARVPSASKQFTDII